MNVQKTLEQRMSIFALSWPLLIETFLRMLFNSVDVLMLSQYSDDAVAAVGLIGQLVFFVLILFMMVTTGTTTLISQYNGAGKLKESSHIASTSILLVAIVALVTTLLLTVGGNQIISVYNLEPAVHVYAYQYLFIFGLFSIGAAMSTLFSSILRSYGFSRSPMIVTFFCNGLNIVGNYIFLFGPLGAPVLGVTGVAIATVASNIVNAIILYIIIVREKEITFVSPFAGAWRYFKEILGFGAPNAGEMLSFNVAQLVSYKVITISGTAALTASVYSHTYQRFILMIPYAFAMSTQILTGYLVGKKKSDEAYHQVLKIWSGVFVTILVLVGVGAIFRYQIIALFTDDPEIIAIAVTMMLVAVFWETGRTFNLVIGAALKGAGDIHFPVRIGIISMWGVAVFSSYLFGIVFSMGAIGVWIGFSLDEWGRGLLMLYRWRSGVWKQKRLVKDNE